MKKRLLSILSLFPAITASALYVGNPAEPNLIEKGFFMCEELLMKVKVGYQGDFVFDRRLKANEGVHGRIDTFDFHMDQGVISLNFLNRVDVYGCVGAIEGYLSHRPTFDHARREYQTNYSTTWGVGGRVILFEWTNVTIGMEGGYQWANPHIKWDALNGTAFTTGAVMRYREWQVAASVSYHVDVFYPYIGVKYSNVHALLTQLRSDLLLPQGSFKMRNRDYFGMVIGCTLSSGKIFDLTIEARMIDEQAISLAGNIKF